MRRKKAFTLVELLVVIGIIAILISTLLPALNKARKQADTVKCLATMRQFAACFAMYAQENNGYYPPSVFYFNPNPSVPPGSAADVAAYTSRTYYRRWPDYLGKYWNNGRLVNPLGDSTQDAAKTWDTVGSIMASGKNSIINGCTAWQQNQRTYILKGAPAYSVNTTISTTHNGYAMNIYPSAPNPVALQASGFYNWPYRAAATGAAGNGWFMRATTFTRPAERCLLADNAHRDMSVSAYNTAGPWYTDPAGNGGNGMSGWTSLPPVPDIFVMTLDWNRHGRKAIGNSATDPGCNMVFCDGHASTVSLNEAIKAVRFIDPKLTN